MGNTKKATQPRPLTFAEVKAKIRRPQRIVDIVLDAESAARIEELTALLELLAASEDDNAKDVARQLQAAERQADKSRVRMVLEAVSHRDYKALQDAHPATAERLAEVAEATGERWAFDPDEFAPVLVQAQLIEPQPASDEEFQEFWDGLSDGQLRQLWVAALGVQMQVTTLTRSTLAAQLI